MVTTSYMSLELPTVSSTAGPTWATMLNEALSLIDAHDHSSGNGARVTPDGLDINADLSIGSNNLTTVRSLRLENQGSTLVGASDIRSLYVYNNNLYYNTNTGTAVRITNGSSIDVGAVATNYWERRAVSGNITILASDAHTFYDIDTSASRNITLPAANSVTAGRYYIFKDGYGMSETYAITIARAGSDTIDDAGSNITLQGNWRSWILVSDGSSNWSVIAGYWTGTTVSANAYTSLGSSVTYTSATTATYTAGTNTTLTCANSGITTVTSGSSGVTSITCGSSGTTVITAASGRALYVGSSDVSVGYYGKQFKLGTRSVTDGNYTIDSTGGNGDQIVIVKPITVPITVTLPTPTAGRELIIKDGYGCANAGNYVIIAPASGATKIDAVAGNRTFTANFFSVRLVADGTDWHIIS